MQTLKITNGALPPSSVCSCSLRVPAPRGRTFFGTYRFDERQRRKGALLIYRMPEQREVVFVTTVKIM